MAERTLQLEYETVTRNLLRELGKLYLAQRGARIADTTEFEKYIQLQLMVIMNGTTTNLTQGNVLSETLNDLRNSAHISDKNLRTRLDNLWDLLQEFAQGRAEYLRIVDDTKTMYTKLKERYSKNQSLSESLLNDTTTLETKELLLALIMQGGYQGTSDTIDAWLEELTS